MKKFYFLFYALIFNLLNAQEIKDFWEAKTVCIRGIEFESKKKEYYAKNLEIATKEGERKEFCTIIGTKKNLFELEGKDKKQAELEFGYFLPTFMEYIFTQIKKYAIPPEAILNAFPNCDIVYTVKLEEPYILISSKVIAPKIEKKIRDEETIKWEGGFFEIPWDSVLPETLGGESMRGPLNSKKLNLLCNFPTLQEIIVKEDEELYHWVKETPGQREVNELIWHKDMFKQFTEVGYFSAFYSKHIFPQIKKYPEVPSRFEQENFLLTYVTQLDLTGVVLRPIAKSGDENWEGVKIRIAWNDAIPDEVKTYMKK